MQLDPLGFLANDGGAQLGELEKPKNPPSSSRTHTLYFVRAPEICGNAGHLEETVRDIIRNQSNETLHSFPVDLNHLPLFTIYFNK